MSRRPPPKMAVGMRRRLDLPLIAAGPLVAGALGAVHVALGAAALVALLAIALWPERRRPSRPPVVVVADLAPRRSRPAPEVSVEALLSRGPGVRPIAADALERGPVRRVPVTRRTADASVVTAGWRLATRANARLTDAFAVRLGLSDCALPTLKARDPDPVLLAATWHA